MFAIDDAPKHANDYANHGIQCFVPKKSYNSTGNCNHENIVHFTGYHDIMSYLKNYNLL